MTIAVTQGVVTVAPGGGQTHFFNSPPGLTPFYANMWTVDPADQDYFDVGVGFTSTAPGNVAVRFAIMYTDEPVTHLPDYSGE